ncbi:MAG TPA: tetratricopeptide repeat protein [Rhizomicrobium sp.]|jgi:cytochrome c-type biogenesis protein CcmH|nr:tetratricopeptide repeat protein [Rhizomicrobium sp.]
MMALTYLIFALVALIAAGFVVGPVVLRGAPRGRWLLAGAGVLFVLGVGGAVYFDLGQPALATRTLAGDKDESLNALIGRLAAAVRKHPADPRGWALLGQSYLTAHDPQEAANAFARSIDAAGAMGQRYPELYSAYGEALTESTAGAVTPDAEAAFTTALQLDPKDKASRYFLGLANAARGNAPVALQLWKSLLADTPPNAPLHADLVDRIAQLTARGGGGAPDIGAMVAGLAERLKTNPNDPQGWQRLIRAYAVLGDKAKARAALGDARHAMAGRPDMLSALDAEKTSLGL